MIFLRFSSSFTIRGQVNPAINPRYDVLAWFRRDGGGRLTQELRVMVAIGIKQHLDRHPKKTRRFPRICATLHQPGRGRMPQSMRSDLASFRGQLGESNGASEPRLDGFDRGTVELDKVRVDGPRSDPAPHVSEQPVRNWRRRLPLLGRTPPLSEPIEDSVFEIHVRSARVTVRRRGRNGAGAGSGIEADQNKARDMTKRALARLNLLILQRSAMPRLDFAISPARPQQCCRFAAA